MAHFVLTKEDFLAASWHIQRKYRLLHYAWAVVVGSLVALFLSRGILGLTNSILAGGLAVVLGVSIRMFLNRRKVVRVFNDHFAEEPEMSVDVSGEEIEFVRKGGTLRIKKEQIKFWSENERFLLLYQGRDFAQILLKQALSAEEDQLIRKLIVNAKRI